MSDATAFGPPPRPPRPVNAGFGTTPFARLARAHFASVAGDATFVIAMASSVFFSLDFNDARWRVALFLVLTLIPFAVVGPFLGPAIDRARSGRRLMVVGTAFGRAILCFLIIRHEGSPLFYLEAFGMLVLGKTYHVAKAALVPSTVRSDDELVEANSKLALSSAVAGVVAAGPAAILSRFGLEWVLAWGTLVFLAAGVLALRIAKAPIAELPPDEVEKAELRGIGIRRAAEAMGTVRACVGFLSFLLAFAFKDSNTSMGAVLVGAQGGVLLGAALAPKLRAQASEERIITGSVAAIAGVALLVALGARGVAGAALLSLVMGSAGSAAKQSFDALVQRDAPDANFGRQFARFESRFQLFWCFGALIPVVVSPALGLGFAVIGLACLYAAFRYVLGARRAQEEHERRLLLYAAEGELPPEVTAGRLARVRRALGRGEGEPTPRRRRLTAAQLAADARQRVEKLADDEALARDAELARETEHLLDALEFRSPDPLHAPPKPPPPEWPPRRDPALDGPFPPGAAILADADDHIEAAPTDAVYLAASGPRPVPGASPRIAGADPTEVVPLPPPPDDDATVVDGRLF